MTVSTNEAGVSFSSSSSSSNMMAQPMIAKASPPMWAQSQPAPNNMHPGFFAGMAPPQHGYASVSYHHRDDPMEIIENWDFARVSRADAKSMAKVLINSFSVCIFIGATIGFAIFAAIFMCILKRVRKAVQFHHDAVNAFRVPGEHHHH